jgi:dipeptidyl aminopeptidase/acylaminoacyl peptidase
MVFPDEHHWIRKGGNSRFLCGEVPAWLKKHLED